MNEQQIQALAHEIINQTILEHWGFWLLVVAIAVIAGAAAVWGGSYFAKRGAVKVAKTDRDEIIAQLRRNARATEAVKSAISLGE